jgi:hypothetical protein
MDAVSTYLAVIDSQDELFVSLHTRDLALAEERKKAAAVASVATAAPGATTLSSPSPLSLQALLQKQTELAGLGKRTCLEDCADPVGLGQRSPSLPPPHSLCPPPSLSLQRLFKVPLIPTVALPSWEGGKGSAFAARLPDFSLDPRSGNNCLVARCVTFEARLLPTAYPDPYNLAAQGRVRRRSGIRSAPLRGNRACRRLRLSCTALPLVLPGVPAPTLPLPPRAPAASSSCAASTSMSRSRVLDSAS